MIRYAIADRHVLPSDCERWAALDIDFVQLRDKTLDAGPMAALARKMLLLLGRTQLIINGRADVAAAVGAAGVHLTAHTEELTPDQVRLVFDAAGRPAPAISVSCHGLAEVERARDAGVDLILFGPVFEKRIEGEIVVEGSGLDVLRRACSAAGETKVLALGGVTRENSAQCLQAGASGVAGIRLFA